MLYGSVEFKDGMQTLSVLGNEMSLASFGLRNNTGVTSVTVDGRNVPFTQRDNVLFFDETKKYTCNTVI